MREVKKYQHSKYPQHDESSASQQSSEEEQQDDELINEEVLRVNGCLCRFNNNSKICPMSSS